LSADNDLLLDLLKKMVAVPSMDGKEAGVAKLVYEFTTKIGMTAHFEEVLPERSNVIATKQLGSGGKTVVLNTHMDVVPVGDGWVSDPFQLTVKGNKAYGRGACDAKGPLVAMLMAIKRILKTPDSLNGKIIMTAVVDEEDSSRGAKKMIENLAGDYGIVGEPTNCLIAPCHKGSIRPVICIEGKTAHASLPHQGVNAIEGAGVFIIAMRKLIEKLTEIKHPLLGSPTATITKIAGGIKENIVPDHCEMIIDRRMVPGESEAEVVAAFASICEEVNQQVPGIRAYIKQLKPTTGGPSEISPDSEYAKAALKISSKITGHAPEPFGLTCGCDMTHLMKIGIPTVVVGPGSLDQAHQANEFIEIVQLEKAVQIYEGIIRHCLSK
jgi:acetylornithine deacetylase/succinyl-diaminopimelate desuccinylase family protein